MFLGMCKYKPISFYILKTIFRELEINDKLLVRHVLDKYSYRHTDKEILESLTHICALILSRKKFKEISKKRINNNFTISKSVKGAFPKQIFKRKYIKGNLCFRENVANFKFFKNLAIFSPLWD